MRLLHTSDWHLGRRLCDCDRYRTFEQFLTWLTDLIAEQSVDTLLVAGDVFDTTTPSHQAQKLYYDFLAGLQSTSCRHVVVIAGNHDSPTLLTAPKSLLNALNVTVVGSPGERCDDEIIALHDEDGALQAVVCAIPYLRERDILHYGEHDTLREKDEAIARATALHYRRVVDRALELYDITPNVPLIASGHLFAAGCTTQTSERNLYVGSLGVLPADTFPPEIDYLALGHLHHAQQLNGIAAGGYCGSPIPFDFGENQDKYVNIIDFDGKLTEIRKIPVPHFDRLRRIEGDVDSIVEVVAELVRAQCDDWCEIIRTGGITGHNLKEIVDSLTQGAPLRVVRICDASFVAACLTSSDTTQSIKELTPSDIFEKRLAMASDLDEETKRELRYCHDSIVYDILHEDVHANR